jgi:LacI family transcriptional regulator
MALTIYDIAKRAGVGIGTVSRVLNNSPKVSEATRRKVMAVIQEMDYVPNPFARRLSWGKALSLAVIAPFFTRRSSVERLRGVAAALAETEYSFVIYNVETAAKRDHYFAHIPQRERGIDGLIVITLPPRDSEAQHWLDSGLPLVLVDAAHPILSSVVTDDVAGGYMATKHLLSLGHRRIAFLGERYPGPFDFFSASRKRYLGYQKALEEIGISLRPEYVATGEFGRYEARETAGTLLKMGQAPTAIVVASDTEAMGVLEVAREQGLRIPQDLSVIGYDDIDVAEYLGLTTIRQPLFESGWRGAQLLFHLMAGTREVAKPICEWLPLELVVRKTTAPPGVS